jgi:ATP-dependent helicase/nuclease subunit B
MNTLANKLATVCRDHLLREKWLIAPSRRVGHQWLDCLALGGESAVNVHIKTLRSMAVDLASSIMVERQATLVSPQGALFLMDRVLRRLPKGRLKYLAGAAADHRLAETVLSSIEAVWLAALDPLNLDHGCLEVRAKSEDLAVIAAEYAKDLASEQLVDYPHVLQMAVDRVTNSPDCLGDETIVLLPDDLRPSALERRLLESLPSARRHVLKTDLPADASSEKSAESNLDRLRWLRVPAEAPDPVVEKSVEMVRAVGEINEVRAVIRHCLAENLGFDTVELLHTDADTYVPLIYDCLLAVEPADVESGDDLPATFTEGIPVRYSRPGRSLSMWLTWMQEDFPQATLVKAIREGLLEIPSSGKERSGLNRLAAQFRGIGIGVGRSRYLSKIDEHINGLKTQLDGKSESSEEGEEGESGKAIWLKNELRDALVIRDLVSRVLEITPDFDASAKDVLGGAKKFIETLSRRANKLDQFAAKKLLDEIQGLEQWLSDDVGESGLDAWQWLADLPGQMRVLGSGPRPGKLHVDHVRSGGHSGRPHTFIVGLDDSRFPGTGLQDPLLLDSERRKLSAVMPTAAARLEETIEDFVRLLSRLRGHLVLSFCCHSVVEDQEMFPSPLLLSAFRVLSSQPDADQSDLLAALDAPVSFAPAASEQCLTSDEWWLWRLCGSETVDGANELVQRQFPHLAQGSHASRQRLSDDFTVYDGRVPAAGKRLDPTADKGRVASASALQTLGKCPLQFFYKYGLRIELPDEVIVDSTRWLDPLAFGSLLHELFEQFMRELLKKNEPPEFDRDHARLEELLVQKIAEYEDLYPPPTQSAFQSQSHKLRIAAATFLREEERFCKETGSRPIYLEASLGLRADGHGTPLDTIDPVPITLPNGKQISTRGRIDRIDQVGDGAIETYAVWDYKTGSTYGYDRADPFRQGRLMQPLLYVSIVGHCLREAVSPKAQITNFGFFFPGIRAAGQRVSWSSSELAAGMNILEQLCEVIHHGAFLPTNDHETDCTYCDYVTICGDVATVAAASQRKLDNRGNRLLKPLRELRSNG